MPSATAKIGRYLLDHPQAPLTLSIGELAVRAGTSAATVTRFCRTIGYTGYVPLRVGIATELGRSAALVSWRSEIGRSFGPDDSAEALLSMLIGGHTRTLREATAAINLETMVEISKLIARCSQVDIYGVGGSAMMAGELQGRLYRIGIRAYNWSEVHDGLTSAAIQGPGTIAIGVSLSGRTEEVIEMLTVAGNAGAETVAVVNDPNSPLAELAQYSVVTSMYGHVEHSAELSAKHGQLLVMDLLYLLVAQANFDRVSERLAASAGAVAVHRRPKKSESPTSQATPKESRLTN